MHTTEWSVCSGTAYLSGAFFLVLFFFLFYFLFFHNDHCLLTQASEERSVQKQLFPYLQAKPPLRRLTGLSHIHPFRGEPCLHPSIPSSFPPSPGGDVAFSHPRPQLLRHSATTPQQVRLDLMSARDCPSAAGAPEGKRRD